MCCRSAEITEMAYESLVSGIEKGRTVYQKIGYVDRCGTIGFLQGFSSFLFKRLVFLLLIINRPTAVGR